MKRLAVISLALLAVGALASMAPAEGQKCAPCCEPSAVSLRAEIVEQKYTVKVPVKQEYSTKTRQEDRMMPCCRLVPVCVTDPCTGCTRTEYRQETVLEKVKVTVVEVVPDKKCSSKDEVRTRYCTTIVIEPRPTAVPACLPAAEHCR